MDKDEPPFVDFICTHCGEVLCRTDGRCITLMIGKYVGTIWIREIELECRDCGTTRWWFSKQEKMKYERIPRLKKSH